MPLYKTAETTIDIARNSLLLDTNVLVAAFYSREDAGRQEYAKYVLDDLDRPLLVPTVVVVEAWGMLVGSRKETNSGTALLAWLNSPGRATIVPPQHAGVKRTQELVEAKRIDCVDAMLAELATDITQYCGLKPSLEIATFDTRDFLQMTRKDGLQISLLDMRTLDTIEIT